MHRNSDHQLEKGCHLSSTVSKTHLREKYSERVRCGFLNDSKCGVELDQIVSDMKEEGPCCNWREDGVSLQTEWLF